MSKIQDLSTLGQVKEGKILDLRLPSPDARPITTKEFSEFSVYNFDQVGKALRDILEYLKGQNNVNEVLKQRLDTVEAILDAWIKEAKKLDTKKDSNMKVTNKE